MTNTTTGARPVSRTASLAAAAALLLGSIAISTGVASAATTRTVGSPGTIATYTLIQDAIDASFDGDVVEVLPGEYAELIDFGGREITVQSTDGAEVTTINAYRDGRAVTFDDGEGPGAVLNGFTITGGLALPGQPSSGGGILIAGSSPTIRNNVIVDNVACSGAGISSSFSSPTIVDNVIADNYRDFCTGGSGGGGIAIIGDGGATTTIAGNLISGNSIGGFGVGGGIEIHAGGEVSIERNIIRGNYAQSDGGAISIVNGTNATIVGNEISGNVAGRSGGGIDLLVPGGSAFLTDVIVGNTIVDNTAVQGAALNLDGWQAGVELANNVISADSNTVFCGDLYYNGDPEWQDNILWSPTGPATSGQCASPNASTNRTLEPTFVVGSYIPAAGSEMVDMGGSRPEYGPADAAGNARVVDGNGDGAAVVDIGAYERQPGPTATEPSAPLNLAGTRVGSAVELQWSPPADDGGSSVTSYEILEIVTNTLVFVDAGANQVTLTDLASGNGAEIEVRALNEIGAGPAAIVFVAAATAASAPSSISATRSGTTATVTWTPPVDDGQAPIWGYDVHEVVSGQRVITNASTLFSTFQQLDPAEAVSFEVRALNEIGPGTPATTQLPGATVPGEPTDGSARRLKRNRVSVNWAAPTDDGGAAITGYQVTETVSGQTQTVGASTTTVTFAGISKSSAYDVEIRAVNAVGAGTALVVGSGGGGGPKCHPKKGCSP